ncbi:MAG: hypothetical protein KF901_34275 [Myxococcales bacterium]|nr:hypothetical protein [Myxococcales bacterium]
MSAPSFDPGSFYELDVARGTVRARGGNRVLVLYDSSAAALVSAAARSGAQSVLEELGSVLGAQARELVGDVTNATPEAVLGEAAALLGTFGWGRLGLERWGGALVVTVADAPALPGEALEAMLDGFFTALTSRPVGCVAVEERRFLLIDPGIRGDVREWARGGMKLPEVLSRLGASEVG